MLPSPAFPRCFEVGQRAGVGRGLERLVTGSDGSARYTNVHYYRFARIG
ncbi:MAG: hypothetical protein ACRDIF_05445 [Actinomycetota bacterium]